MIFWVYMLKLPQNQRFNQPILETAGRNGSILTNRDRGKNLSIQSLEGGKAKSKSPTLQMGEWEILAFLRLLGLDRAHGAGALASAAVDAGAGVDFHVVSAHGDRAHGAGGLASAAGDAGVTNFTCHVTYTSKAMLMF